MKLHTLDGLRSSCISVADVNTCAVECVLKTGLYSAKAEKLINDVIIHEDRQMSPPSWKSEMISYSKKLHVVPQIQSMIEKMNAGHEECGLTMWTCTARDSFGQILLLFYHDDTLEMSYDDEDEDKFKLSMMSHEDKMKWYFSSMMSEFERGFLSTMSMDDVIQIRDILLFNAEPSEELKGAPFNPIEEAAYRDMMKKCSELDDRLDLVRFKAWRWVGSLSENQMLGLRQASNELLIMKSKIEDFLWSRDVQSDR